MREPSRNNQGTRARTCDEALLLNLVFVRNSFRFSARTNGQNRDRAPRRIHPRAPLDAFPNREPRLGRSSTWYVARWWSFPVECVLAQYSSTRMPGHTMGVCFRRLFAMRRFFWRPSGEASVPRVPVSRVSVEPPNALCVPLHRAVGDAFAWSVSYGARRNSNQHRTPADAGQRHCGK